MCSILGILDINGNITELRQQALAQSKLMRHRGPDWSGIWNNNKAILAHERLAIVDVNTGGQPLLNNKGTHILAVNGEIYNHKDLRNTLTSDFTFQTESDCEIILAMYQEHGIDFIDKLSGMFAFVLYDAEQDRYLIARDHIGIIPLYTGFDSHGNFYVASEMKALINICNSITEFPPGHFLCSARKEPTPYYHRDWYSYDNVKDNTTSLSELNQAFEASVKRHLMSDVPYGVLLSGGLDSSLVSSVTKKYAALRIEDNENSQAWWPQLHSFAVGLKGSPDLKAAQTVADAIGTVHHEIHFSIREGIDVLEDVIYHLETYDVTTIRASVPMYLMARKIKAMGIKMVLSGEGADEIFGGYLYFHKAPDSKEFHEETLRKLSKLHLFDCLRANKSTAAWGVEVRVPFLDKQFLDVAMRINPQDKMCTENRMEKWVLRKSFDNGQYLPKDILWRQKEQFSDGVGYSWIDSLKAYANEQVSDQQLSNARFRFAVNTPTDKESYLYRSMFERHFPSEDAVRCVPNDPSVACSTAQALEWDKSFKELTDPSGRAVVAVHNQAYQRDGDNN